tara:strand:- start:12111 stop:14156 length:2046 start_codon:yes stop_codon:yes gene_type:complete
MSIFNPINYLNNSIFGKKVKLYYGERIIDVLLHFPKNIFNKVRLSNLHTDDIGKIVTIDIKIVKHQKSYNNKAPYKIYAITKNQTNLHLLFFKGKKNYLEMFLKIGEFYKITGKLQFSSNIFQIIHPKKENNHSRFEIYQENEPVYNLPRKRINKNAFRKLILKNIETFSKSIFPREWINQELLKKKKWSSFGSCIKNIHISNKKKMNELEIYRERLAYDEILSSFLIFNKVKHSLKKKQISNNINKFYSDKLINNLDFRLTLDQQSAIDQIFDDLKHKRMYRLLQGDVGSGKTIISVICAIDIIKSHHQVVVMAPTEILASQHYKYFQNYLKPFNIKIRLLTGKIKNKKEIYKDIQNKKVDLLIGTHAVYNSSISFKNLGLIIIDEQHKFGVKQRINLIEKAKDCHILIMSATPIPRSLTFAIYGEISVSNIKTKPYGRKSIITSIFDLKKIPEIISGIERKINKNEQIFWVLPQIGYEQNSDEINLLTRYQFLKKNFKNQVTIVHGRMTEEEIANNMNEFILKKKMILISTTLIEVGINIPSASLMIIESANKYGLAQLHQLRGRIARNNIQSHCVLLPDNTISEVAKTRLAVLKNSNDGFEIAEQDLKLRGSGDFFGTNQSGLPSWRFFDPQTDVELINHAKNNSEYLLINKEENLDKIEFLIKVFLNKSNFKNFTSA